MTNNKHTEAFWEAYNRLNPEQKKAVDTLNGAVIVNAGPGTGKTQILATRIGNILLSTDTPPENILCLTYTDNGAVEMRNRLLQIVGTAAYNIPIHTFHSFCNEVIQDNLSYFGKYNLEPVGELEESELFKQLIDSIEKESPLKRYTGEIYYDQTRLKNLFTLMKKEALSAEYFNERIDIYIQSLPVKEGFFYKRKYKEFAAGDANPRKIEEETEKMNLLKAAIALYSRYNQMMADIQRYTYDDMILWVLDAFQKNNNMLLDYQERYLYFLIDEFQDTSRSQNMLIQYLTNYWDEPNLFVVGDADQSIFSFQDANVENIHHFKKNYENFVTEINLVNNYRSTQIILDAAYKLIVQNQERSVENDHALKAASTALENIKIAPEIIEYANKAQEAIGVVLKVESLINSGVEGKEIAIIYRNHAQVENITTVLSAKNIPVNIKKPLDVLSLPLIEHLMTILTWIHNENTLPYSADYLLFQILHYNFFDLQPIQIAQLSIEINQKNLNKKDDKLSLRKALYDLKLQNGDMFAPPDNGLKQVSILLENLIKTSHNVTLQQLIELVIQRANILGYIMKNSEKPFLMQALSAFFNFVKEACKRNPDMQLSNLLRDIELMKKDKIGIPLYKTASPENGVNLITAHGSKGSEYAHVFIIGCIDKVWDEEKSNSRYEFKYPDNLISNHNTANALEESRRLFYVAATRAKTNLYISYSAKDDKEKSLVKSKFVAEIQDGMNIETVQAKIPEDTLIDALGLQLGGIVQPEIAPVEEAYISRILQTYSLSVTHLNNYLDCPLKFYYQNLIKVPAAKSASMTFGSAVHFALQRLFEKMRSNNNIFLPKERMLDDFKWYMQKNRDAFTPEEYALRCEYGEKILPSYYDTHIEHWHKTVSVEYNIRNVQLDGIPLNGKIDKIEFFGNDINVVDYKTGKFTNAKKKFKQPGEEEPNGGDYWRQAVFYKILIDNHKQNNWHISGVVFDFVEPLNDEYITEKVVVSPQDAVTVKQQIKTVWEKIQNREFTTGCGKPDCEWCNFVKTNNL
ncbi:MAG: ATP-dependent helicase [Chitinophagaceae bacterium]|jgi:DNA helicase-2/ATP-dependent DNA helicase PcrA|nr:ATP-dependent helicase [Chitinophagaceae bacterium]